MEIVYDGYHWRVRIKKLIKIPKVQWAYIFIKVKLFIIINFIL